MPAELLALLAGEPALAPEAAFPEADASESQSILKRTGDALPFPDPSTTAPDGIDLPPLPLPATALEDTLFRIAAGETVRLEIEWTTGEREGPYSQSARLSTSDSTQPVLEFVVRGNVAKTRTDR